jgi:hypothetical protein
LVQIVLASHAASLQLDGKRTGRASTAAGSFMTVGRHLREALDRPE